MLAIARDRRLLGDIRFSRIAVTPVQIDELDLPTAPPKPTDRRAFKGETVQCEAIRPDVLAQIIRDAINGRFDRKGFAGKIEAELKVREHLAPLFATLLNDGPRRE